MTIAHRPDDDTYPVELTAPDLSPWRQGNTGVPYVTRLTSAVPGPTVMVMALTHGNEICGAHTVSRLLRDGFQPARGTLLLGFANVDAYHRFDATKPTASRFIDEDLNRVWDTATLDGPRQSVECARARALRPLVDTVDYLLDLHSMQHATAPLMLSGLTEKGIALAQAVAIPDLIVADGGHQAGRRLRDYGRFADPSDPATALLAECGQHWAAASATIADQTTLRFLDHLGLIHPDQRAQFPVPALETPARVIEVTDPITIKTKQFHFCTPFYGMEIIPEAGTVIAHDGPETIVTPYPNCVLIMPSRRLAPGQTAVRLGRFRDPN